MTNRVVQRSHNIVSANDSIDIESDKLLQRMPLRKNFLWTICGNVVYAGSQWLMLVIVAKLGTPEMVGQFALGFAVTAPIIIFTNLNLRAVQATDQKAEYKFHDYLLLRLATTTIGILIIIAVVFFSEYSGS